MQGEYCAFQLKCPDLVTGPSRYCQQIILQRKYWECTEEKHIVSLWKARREPKPARCVRYYCGVTAFMAYLTELIRLVLK